MNTSLKIFRDSLIIYTYTAQTKSNCSKPASYKLFKWIQNFERYWPQAINLILRAFSNLIIFRPCRGHQINTGPQKNKFWYFWCYYGALWRHLNVFMWFNWSSPFFIHISSIFKLKHLIRFWWLLTLWLSSQKLITSLWCLKTKSL